jgi:hypothetical protein
MVGQLDGVYGWKPVGIRRPAYGISSRIGRRLGLMAYLDAVWRTIPRFLSFSFSSVSLRVSSDYCQGTECVRILQTESLILPRKLG